MNRRAVAAVAAGSLIALVAVCVWSVLFRADADVAAGRPARIEIPVGASSADAGRILAAKGVVPNAAMFGLRVRMAGAERDLRPGVYELRTGIGYAAAIDALRQGPGGGYVTLTIPEGWTIPQVAARVEEKTGIPRAEFAALATKGARDFHFDFLASNPTGSLEGYLFPKTYRVRPGATSREVISMMLEQFGREISGVDLADSAARGLTLHGLVTVASMVERESKVEADRSLVASVIYNRLARDMFLEIDATVQYVVGNKPRLLYRDLRVRSPYNTYVNKGLPPGPIASPGLASIHAAAAPGETGYLYYVLTHKDGSHSFSVTREEFLQLKAQAKKGLQ